MEQTILMTGLTLSGLLIFPLAMEWFRKMQIGLILLAALILTVYLAAPHSGSARSVASVLNTIPETVHAALVNTEDGIARIRSEYFRAFH